METGFLYGSFEVQCTHQFVETLKKLWNQMRSSCGCRFLLYKNVKMKMTDLAITFAEKHQGQGRDRSRKRD